MGNRSRFHAPRTGEYRRGWEEGHHNGIHHGMNDAVHLLLADLPDSGVVAATDDSFTCDDAACHGCELERRGFKRLAAMWSNESSPCERHP